MAAHTDNVDDPKLAATLLLARRGSAFFARQVAGLTDAQFAEPSRLAGWSRAHVIAHVAYNARALTHLTEWAATGTENPMYASPDQRNAEIELGATLPPQALRNLTEHAIVHLNVEWRDLPADAWGALVKTAQGRTVPVSETAWMRAREIWLHAVDLDTGASVDDLPAEFHDRLLPEIVALWKSRGDATPALALRPDDRQGVEYRLDDSVPDPAVLSGPIAQLVAWATGRLHRGLTVTGGGDIPPAPRWL